MKYIVTTAIILQRTDYGEADRILTLLTPDYGKLSLLARGVRKVKSKLAGGIELFSVSEITFIQGKGSIGTLVSTRLTKHYDKIVGNLERTMLGYELIRQLHKTTEDEPESEYFELLHATFEALDDIAVAPDIIRFWFGGQLLRLAGHTPNLEHDAAGERLQADRRYGFDAATMSFVAMDERGKYTADHIKLIRLCFQGHVPRVIAQVRGVGNLLPGALAVTQSAQLSQQ